VSNEANNLEEFYVAPHVIPGLPKLSASPCLEQIHQLLHKDSNRRGDVEVKLFTLLQAQLLKPREVSMLMAISDTQLWIFKMLIDFSRIVEKKESRYASDFTRFCIIMHELVWL